MSDAECADFLKRLDDSDRVTVNDWEASFISSNLETKRFSTKQRECIASMVKKYGDKIGW